MIPTGPADFHSLLVTQAFLSVELLQSVLLKLRMLVKCLKWRCVWPLNVQWLKLKDRAAGDEYSLIHLSKSLSGAETIAWSSVKDLKERKKTPFLFAVHYDHSDCVCFCKMCLNCFFVLFYFIMNVCRSPVLRAMSEWRNVRAHRKWKTRLQVSPSF